MICAVCRSCRPKPGIPGRCIYGGPFAGYVAAEPKMTFEAALAIVSRLNPRIAVALMENPGAPCDPSLREAIRILSAAAEGRTGPRKPPGV